MHPFLSTSNAPRSTTRYFAILAILFAHLVLLYMLQQGKIVKWTPALPTEITINLIQAKHVEAEKPAAKPIRQLTASLPQTMQVTSPQELPTIALTPVADHVISAPAIQAATIAAVADNAPDSASIAPTAKLVSAIEYLRSPQADYPPLARRMGEQGKVVMRVLVNEKGYAEKVEIQKSSGFNRLDEAARLAVMRALFKPYFEDGKPLMVLATATVNFSLSS